MLGLLGILEAGRGIAAPLAVGGEWTLEFDAPGACANLPSGLNISQSGAGVLIALKGARPVSMEGRVEGATLSAGWLTAAIGGKPGARTLEGALRIEGCRPAAFRAVRQVPRKQGE